MCIFAPAIGAKKCPMCHLKTANIQIDMDKENKNLNRIKVVQDCHGAQGEHRRACSLRRNSGGIGVNDDKNEKQK